MITDSSEKGWLSIDYPGLQWESVMTLTLARKYAYPWITRDSHEKICHWLLLENMITCGLPVSLVRNDDYPWTTQGSSETIWQTFVRTLWLPVDYPWLQRESMMPLTLVRKYDYSWITHDSREKVGFMALAVVRNYDSELPMTPEVKHDDTDSRRKEVGFPWLHLKKYEEAWWQHEMWWNHTVSKEIRRLTSLHLCLEANSLGTVMFHTSGGQ